MPDFTSMSIIMGPHKLIGHLSVTWSTECQMNLTVCVIVLVLRSLHPPRISPMSSRTVEAIEVKQQAEDDENLRFQSNCKCLVWSSGCRNWYVEPIVNPGELLAHAHTVMGGNGFNSTMNFDTARASTCTTCKAREDLANHWILNLYSRAPDGTFEDVPQTGGMLVYYLQRSDPRIQSTRGACLRSRGRLDAGG